VSLQAVQRIIGRAVTDQAFRDQIKTNPDDVLSDRDITPEEAQALKNMDWNAVGSVALDLDARVSRMGMVRASCK
jgi:hypothetical protein